jgi:hypothetical protein
MKSVCVSQIFGYQVYFVRKILFFFSTTMFMFTTFHIASYDKSVVEMFQPFFSIAD